MSMEARPRRSSCATSACAETFTYHHENVLGTSLELRVEAETEPQAETAEQQVLREVDRLTMVLSTYQNDSEITRWLSKAAGPVPVSKDLHAVLSACDAWESKSSGAFNTRVEAISQVWKRGAATEQAPIASELAAVG